MLYKPLLYRIVHGIVARKSVCKVRDTNSLNICDLWLVESTRSKSASREAQLNEAGTVNGAANKTDIFVHKRFNI